MKKNKLNDKNSIIIFSLFVGILIALIIWYSIYNRSSENYNNIKVNKSKYLIYTKSKKSVDNYNQYTPYVNIKGEIGDLINKDIIEYISSFTNGNTAIIYDYSLNGKILSLIIKVEDHSYVESATILYFRSYNINLDTLEVLAPEAILSYFELSSDDVEVILDNKIEEYYRKQIKNNLVNEKECNYNCFLKTRNFKDGLEDAEYYINKGKLVIYKPYVHMAPASDKSTAYGFKITE